VDQDTVAVIAGFQGVDEEGNITTLGRGGSDTSAVAVAAALEADVCEIYTDVDGVYTTDPNLVPAARKLERITFEEMLQMASLGAKVLQIRSVKFAMQYGVPLHVRSSFSEAEGTWVVREEDAMEGLVVSGVTYNRNEAKIRLRGVNPRASRRACSVPGEAGIVVDMILQNVGQDGSTDMTFTVPRSDFRRARHRGTDGQRNRRGRCLRRREHREGLDRRARHEGSRRRGLAHVRGAGRRGINIQLISTSEIKISVLIEEKHGARGARCMRPSWKPAHRTAGKGDSPDRSRGGRIRGGSRSRATAARCSPSARATPLAAMLLVLARRRGVRRPPGAARRARGVREAALGALRRGRGGAGRACGSSSTRTRPECGGRPSLAVLPGVGAGRAEAIVRERTRAPFSRGGPASRAGHRSRDLEAHPPWLVFPSQQRWLTPVGGD
jgi:hypothetical protein